MNSGRCHKYTKRCDLNVQFVRVFYDAGIPQSLLERADSRFGDAKSPFLMLISMILRLLPDSLWIVCGERGAYKRTCVWLSSNP